MANRYANLPGAAKIKDTYDRINQGFDLVEQDVDQLRADLDQEIADREAAVEYVDQRIDNIIVGGGPDKDPELVDIRSLDPSYTPQREINVAGDVTRDMQAQFVQIKKYSPVVYNVMAYGADPTGSSDSTSAIQNAIDDAHNSGGGEVFFPQGRYRIDGVVTIRNKTFLRAVPGTVILDFSSRDSFSEAEGFIQAVGDGFEGMPSTTATTDIPKAYHLVDVVDTAGFEENDYVQIASTEDAWSGEGKKGEIHLIQNVASSTRLVLAGVTFDSYTTDGYTTIVRKIAPFTFGIEGFVIKGKGVNPESLQNDEMGNRGDTALQVKWAQNFVIKDLVFVDCENRPILIQYSVEGIITNCKTIFAKENVRLQYGISLIGPCQNIVIDKCKSYKDRHFVTTSGSSVGGIPRNIIITNCHLYGSWLSPISTHRGAESLIIKGNFIVSTQSGINIRARSATITDNIIYTRSISGTQGISFIWQPGEVIITGNRIYNAHNGIVLLDGEDYIDVDAMDKVKGFLIANNELINNYDAVKLEYTQTEDRVAHLSKIVNNNIRNHRRYGIFLRNTIDGVIVTGNHILDGASEGIIIYNPKGCIVTNNIVENIGSGRYGIWLSGSGGKSICTENILINTNGIYNTGATDEESIVERNILTSSL